MAVREDDPRLLVVMMQLFRSEADAASNFSLNKTQIKARFTDVVMHRPGMKARFRVTAMHILEAIDELNDTIQPKQEKTSLTGEELWKSIVEASKP